MSKTTGDMLARSGVIMHPFWGRFVTEIDDMLHWS